MALNNLAKLNSFEQPSNQISKPLDQCKFIMTRIGGNGQFYPVNSSGEKITSIPTPLAFEKTRNLWVTYQGYYYDGYSLVLDEHGQAIEINGTKFYIVGGHHKDCVTQKGNRFYFSNGFMADWSSLDEPITWFSPDRKSVYWAGLSESPVIGGDNCYKRVSSYNQIIPITTAFGDAHNDPPLKVLPPTAMQVINRWFPLKGAV